MSTKYAAAGTHSIVAPNGLAWNAPMTVQNFIENHPIAHPYSHLESIRTALNGA